MTKQAESVAHPDLVNAATTTLHSHPGGGGGGLIDKSGAVTTGGSGVASVVFSTSYGSTDYVILATAIDNGDAVLVYVQSGSKSVNGFTVVVENDKGQTQSGVTVMWATGPYSNP